MDQKKCCHACRQHSLQYILSMFTWSQSILFNISCCYFGVICWCPLLVSKGISQNIGGIKIWWLSFISIFSSKITVLRGANPMFRYSQTLESIIRWLNQNVWWWNPHFASVNPHFGSDPVPGVAYLVSHYNVWGTGDGDMTRTWFGGGSLVRKWLGRIALRALSLGLAPSSGHFGISRGTLFSDFASWNSAHPYHWAQSLSDYLWWHSACTLRAMHVTIRTDKPKFLVCISPLISPLEKEGRQLTIFETVWNHQLYSVCHVNLWGYSIFT